jgi:hypothetical protein
MVCQHMPQLINSLRDEMVDYTADEEQTIRGRKGSVLHTRLQLVHGGGELCIINA